MSGAARCVLALIAALLATALPPTEPTQAELEANTRAWMRRTPAEERHWREMFQHGLRLPDDARP